MQWIDMTNIILFQRQIQNGGYHVQCVNLLDGVCEEEKHIQVVVRKVVDIFLRKI